MTGRKKKTKKNKSESKKIIIDEARGLVFNNEQDVYDHFQNEISHYEKEYKNLRQESDTQFEGIEDLETHLSELLQEPDEVWFIEDKAINVPLGIFIGYFETEDENRNFYYIALTYLVDNLPKFVFIHFATDDLSLIKKYQRGKKIYDRNNQTLSDEEAVDALTEGDELAVGLYQAMLKLRQGTDIQEDEFSQYIKHREETIQEPDEIWKKTDSEGRVLVNFIKTVGDDEDVRYIVCTLEDEASESHYLLFSFPTKDLNLVERFRQGEAMDTVSYTREESH